MPKQWNNDYKLKSEPVLRAKRLTPAGEFEVYSSDFDGEVEVRNLKLKDPQNYAFYREFLWNEDRF